MRSHPFAPLRGDGFDDFRRLWETCAKAALDQPNVDAAPSTHQLTAPDQARQSLIHRIAVTQMQQFLSGHGSAFRQPVGTIHYSCG